MQLSAQNQSHKVGLSFKKLFLDYQSQNGGSLSNLRNYHSGYEIAVNYNLMPKLNLVVPLHLGVPSSHLGVEHYEKTIFGLGIHGQYEFLDPAARVSPYVVAGLSGVGERTGTFNIQIPVGLGLNFRVNDRSSINWESTYRKSFTKNRNNFQHGIGFKYLFGKGNMEKPMEDKLIQIDSDGDGIPDDLDLCPQIAGPKELKGCPDTDGDGVADYEDACPSHAGLKSLNGCPDSDGDGVSDKDDECPNLPGTIANKGCPEGDRDNDGVIDSKDRCPDIPGTVANDGCPEENKAPDADGDGIPDSEDACPRQAGPASTQGCPDRDGDGIPDHRDACPDAPGIAAYNGCPDTDGDGIDDSRDKCPNTKGSVANNGCPTIAKADLETLDIAMRAVQFETGRASLKGASANVLRQIADIMKRYPDYNLTISGHTDNTGTASNNQRLSESRAKTCYDFLVRAGISSSRMSYAGYGESRPIANNNTLRGKALNRRVEFNLLPR